MVSLTASQRQVSSYKSLHGTAQLDLFLCSDPDCTFAADLRNITTSENEASQLAVLYTRMQNTSVVLPLGTRGTAGIACTRKLEQKEVKFLKDAQDQGVIYHGVSWKSNAEKWNGSKYGFPMLMPAALAELLWHRVYFVSFQLHGIGDYLGLDTLRYNVLKVKDLVTGWSGCATIILPDPTPHPLIDTNWTVTDDWMYKHGWYEPDADCDYGEALYVFGTYFPQAWLLDPRFKVAGTLRYGAPNYITPDPWPVDDATLGMIYPKGQWPYKTGMPASELQLNLSALWHYGTRMGRTIRVDPEYGKSTKDSRVAYHIYQTSTPQEAGCDPVTCTVLAVGTATIFAWSGQDLANADQVRSFHSALTLLKLYPVWQEWERHGEPVWQEWERRGSPEWGNWVYGYDYLRWERSGDAASAYLWCSVPGSDSMGYASFARVPPVMNATFVPFCDNSVCNHTVNNCSFWDEKGIGFVHGVGNASGAYNPRSVDDLIGGLFYYPLHEHSFPMFPGSGPDSLEHASVNLAIADVLRRATAVLRQQIAVEMANTDSIRTVTGAIIDATIIVVAILAMASGHRDLQGLLEKMLMKVSILVGVPSTTHRTGKLIKVVVMLLTWAVIGASVLLAPALTLDAEVSARGNNPTPDTTTKVEWVAAETLDGTGPFTVTAAVATSISADSSNAALAISFVNVVIAIIATVLLCTVVWRDQMQGRLQQLQDQEESMVARAQQQKSAGSIAAASQPRKAT